MGNVKNLEINDAQCSLGAAVDGVNFLIFEQFVLYILTAAAVGPNGSPFGLFLALLIPFGLPAIIYGVCCSALKKEKLWAAITLFTLVSLQLVAYVFAAIRMLVDGFFTWRALALIGAITPIAIAVALMARALRHFKHLPGRQPHGFQVVLPMETDRDK